MYKIRYFTHLQVNREYIYKPYNIIGIFMYEHGYSILSGISLPSGDYFIVSWTPFYPNAVMPPSMSLNNRTLFFKQLQHIQYQIIITGTTKRVDLYISKYLMNPFWISL